MNFVAILFSFLLPLQVQTYSHGQQLAEPYWAVNAVIDASIILGIGNARSRSQPYNSNPELFLREPDKYDKPKSRRKQLIENYVYNNFQMTSR